MEDRVAYRLSMILLCWELMSSISLCRASVQSSCSTWHPEWLTRMFPTGTEIWSGMMLGSKHCFPFESSFVQGLREHPHCVDRQQGGHQGQEGQGKVHRLPPQEESPGEEFKNIHIGLPWQITSWHKIIFSITTSQPSQTTTLRSHSCGLPG